MSTLTTTIPVCLPCIHDHQLTVQSKTWASHAPSGRVIPLNIECTYCGHSTVSVACNVMRTIERNVTLSTIARGFATSCPDVHTYVAYGDYVRAFYGWNETLINVSTELGHDDAHLFLSLVRSLVANPTNEGI